MTIEIIGTGGIIEGNLGAANVNVNLDSSLNFDGTDDVLTIADAASLDQTGDFTIAVWVRPDTFDSNDRIIARGATGSGDFMISAGSSRRVRVYCKDVNGNAKDTVDNFSAIPLDAWTHLTVVFDRSNNKIQLSINGAAFEEFTGGDTWNGNICNGSNPLRIGFNGSSNYFDGRIADVRFYNTALTIDNAKILASKILSNENLGAGTTNLIGWWKLNNNSITDSSTNSNNASATGTNEVYDDYSVDVYDNSTTTDGTFTVTQGKVECLALSSLLLDGTGDYVNLASSFTMSHDGSSVAVWVKKDNATGNEDVIIGQASDPNLHWMKIDTNGDVIFRDYPNDLHCDTAITDTNWHHIVVTLSGDSNGAIYVDGVAQTLSANAIVGDPTFDVIGIRGTIDDFDGKLRDLKVFDYALSAEQAASLYSNTYPQTPKHNWKMDEGTGATANDTGTGTAANGTLNGNASLGGAAHTQTLNLDGTLTIAANGTLSAPRGNLNCSGGHFGPNSGKFTHNSGTVVLDGSSNIDTKAGFTGTSALNIVSVTNSARVTVAFSCDFTTWTFDSSSSSHRFHAGNGAVSFKGTTLTLNDEVNFTSIDTNAVTLEGADSLNPLTITGTDLDWDSAGSGTEIKLANVNYDPDITTGGGGVTITLTGDCEFDAVTVSGGDTLDLNGQRMECSGNFTASSGSCNVDFGAGMLIAPRINIDSGTYTGEAGASFIVTGSSGGENMTFNDSTFTGDSTTNILINNGTTSCDWNNSGAYAGNLIVGSGTYRSINGTNNKCGNLTVATGGTLDGSDDTLTLSGDFTTSGGLIGKSALDFDGSNDYVTCGSHSSIDDIFDNGGTAEFWIKPESDGEGNFGRVLDKNNWIINVRDESSGAVSLNFSHSFSTTDGGWKTTDRVITLNKWNHVAITYDGSSVSNDPIIYVDGKSVPLTEGSTPAGSYSSDSSSDLIIGNKSDGSRTFDGVIDMARIFDDVRTQSEIRADMFNEHANMANTGNLVGMWQFDEGTGTTVDNVANSGVAAGSLVNSPAWVGVGTFTYGTSTLVMAKSGTQFMYGVNLFDVNNLTINSGSTTKIETINDSGGELQIHGTLTATGTLTSGTVAGNSKIAMQTGGTTIAVGSAANSLSGLYSVELEHSSGTTTLPTCTLKRLMCKTSGLTALANGDLTLTEELQVDSGVTFNANGNTIDVKILDVNGGTLDLRNSTVTFQNNGKLRLDDVTSTLSTGNTTITGYGTGSDRNLAYVPSGGNYEVVGNVEKLDIQSGGDLTVVGAVTDCSFEDTTANIRQWHHTLDTQQLLDADEAGDDDLRLTKPALDNALELMTK